MIWVALGIATLALVSALIALARAAGASARVEELELAARRTATNDAEELVQALQVQRELLAQVVEGDAPTREMILEGRLWRDVDGPAALSLVAKGARLLDVRTPGETSSGIIPGAILIPIDALETRLRELPRDKKAWLVYCAAGSRSAAACEFLSTQGFVQLHNLAAGVGAWSGKLERPA